MSFGNRIGRRVVSQGWRIWCERRKSDGENECRMVVGQGGLIWLKWIPYEGAYHVQWQSDRWYVQWQSDRWFWSRQNPDRRYKQVKPHIQPLEKHVLYGLIIL